MPLTQPIAVTPFSHLHERYFEIKFQNCLIVTGIGWSLNKSEIDSLLIFLYLFING